MAGNLEIKNANGKTITLQNPDTNGSDIVVDLSDVAKNTVVTATKIKATSAVQSVGQDWLGLTYIDPDAIGANPTAKIYPDGTIVGSTDNGAYTKYPNGELQVIRDYSNSVNLGPGAEVIYTLSQPIASLQTWTGWAGKILLDNGVDAKNRALPYVHYSSGSGSTVLFALRNVSTDTITRMASLRLNFEGRWK